MNKENNALIFLDEETDFTGEIEASNIILHGKVSGTIRAERSIRLKSGSYMEGEIYTKDFFPEKGSVYDGELHMISPNPDQENESTSTAEEKENTLMFNNFRSGMNKFFSMLSSWAL